MLYSTSSFTSVSITSVLRVLTCIILVVVSPLSISAFRPVPSSQPALLRSQDDPPILSSLASTTTTATKTQQISKIVQIEKDVSFVESSSSSRDSSSNTNTTTNMNTIEDDTDTDTDTPIRPVNIIIAGGPASGKGTQCARIANDFGIIHLSTGDILRHAVASHTRVGRQAKRYMDAGQLVPDDLMIRLVLQRLEQQDCQRRGFLLDGFPRTAAQADALQQAGVAIDCVLFLEVPDAVLIERVIGRRTDPVTKTIYHLQLSPPPSHDTAVLQRLQHRSDDTKDKVLVRLEQFHSHVRAVQDYYETRMITIDGNRSPADVSHDVNESIKAALQSSTKSTSRVI